MEGYDAPMHILTRQVVSQRGSWWARQSLLAKQEAWRRAREHQVGKREQHRQDHEVLMVELEKLLAQQKEVVATHPPVCMSAAAVTEANLEEMHGLLQNKEFCSPKTLDMLRSMMCEAPSPRPGASSSRWYRRVGEEGPRDASN